MGCGIGLTGLIIANICQPKKIILTDYNVHVMNLLKENVKLNMPDDNNLIGNYYLFFFIFIIKLKKVKKEKTIIEFYFNRNCIIRLEFHKTI